MNSSFPIKNIPNSDDLAPDSREAETSGKLRVLRERLSVGPLEPREVHEGLIVLSEVGDAVLEQAVQNTSKLDSIHEHTHKEEAVLSLISTQVLVIASKVENTYRFMDRLDGEVTDGFKRIEAQLNILKKEVSELKALVNFHINLG